MLVPVGDSFVHVLNVAFVRPDIVQRDVQETDGSGHTNKGHEDVPVVDIVMVGASSQGSLGWGIRVENYTAQEVADIINAGIQRYCQLSSLSLPVDIRPEDMPDGS